MTTNCAVNNGKDDGRPLLDMVATSLAAYGQHIVEPTSIVYDVD